MEDFDFLDDLPEPRSEEVRLPSPPVKADVFGNAIKREAGEFIISGNNEAITGEDTPFRPQIPNEAAFDPRMAFEVALEMEPLDQIALRYGLSHSELELLIVNPLFKKAVVNYKDELLDNGITFRQKAKVQAEAYLKDAHFLIKNPMTPATVKADMIKWMAKVADYEPKNTSDDQGTTFNLQIVL